MAHNDDLIRKIQDLQGRVDNSILPQYEQAKQAVDDLDAQLKGILALGKLTKTSQATLAAITAQQGPAADVLKSLEKPAEIQKKMQASLSGLSDQVASQAQMGPKTAQEYQSLKTSAFATPLDPAAQQTFQKFVSNLQTVHTETVSKSMRTWVQSQIKQGLQVTLSDFAERQRTAAAGEVVSPDESPETKRQFDAANARGLSRVFNRGNFNFQNFRDHMTSGGYTALGYAGLDLGQNIGQYASQPLTGDRFTQEVRMRAGLGLVPGLAGIAGAIGGSFTPAGPYAGAAIGAGIGTAITAPLTALSERHETLRLTSEDFSQTMGRGTAAADKFAQAIEATASKLGTPAGELANSLRTLSGSVVSFNPRGAASLQAILQRGAGDLYPQLVSAQAQAALQIPLSNVYQAMVAGNRAPSAGLYNDAANYYALHGDLAASNQQLIAGGQFAYTPAMQRALAAKGRFDQGATGGDAGSNLLESLARAIPFSHSSRRGQAISDTIAKLNASGGGVEAAGPAKVARDALYTANRTAQEMSEALGYDVSRAGVGVGIAQMTGQGAAGMRPYTAQEVAALTAQQAQLRIQQQQVQAAIRTASPADAGEFKADLGRVQLQLAQSQGQIKQAQVGLFQETLAERQARFEGGYSRLGVAGDALALGGANSFDARVSRNLASRRAFLTGQSAYDLGLASNTTNFLSPMEREQRRTSAAQEDFEARFVLPNQQAMQRIGDTTAGSGLRQADIRTQVARGQATGDISATLTAQNALIAEQVRLQGELQQRLSEGNLTYSQRTQLQTQLKDLTSQTVEAQRQAADTAITGFQNRADAQSSSAYSQSERGSRLRGTSDQTLAQTTQGYDASLQAVAIAKYRRDTAQSTDQRTFYDAQYQSAKNSAEQQGIDAYSQVSMGPVFETGRIRAEHRLSRQMQSAFEPGSVIQSNANLAQMDNQELSQIAGRIKSVRGLSNLTADEKNAIIRNLTGQQESVRDDQFTRQQSVDVGWTDRLTAMSVNAPSFAARLMPGSDRVASLAERRGLGRMSARVFGYTDQQSYRDTEGLGVLPSETNRMAFGLRPGDYPSADGPDAAVYGGKGVTLDSIDRSGIGGGLPPQMVGDLSQAISALVALLGKGISINVTQMDKSTGETAAHTQNAGGIYDAGPIMRGGQAPPKY